MPCIQCTGNPFTIITLAANLWQAACSGQDPPAAAEPASEIGLPLASAVANTLRNAMGGRAARRGIETLAMHGDGTRNRLGQIPVTGGIDPDADDGHGDPHCRFFP